MTAYIIEHNYLQITLVAGDPPVLIRPGCLAIAPSNVRVSSDPFICNVDVKTRPSSELSDLDPDNEATCWVGAVVPGTIVPIQIKHDLPLIVRDSAFTAAIGNVCVDRQFMMSPAPLAKH